MTTRITKIRRSCVVPGDVVTTWNEPFGPGESTYLVLSVDVFPSYVKITHQHGSLTVLGNFVGLVAHQQLEGDLSSLYRWHPTDASGRYLSSDNVPIRLMTGR